MLGKKRNTNTLVRACNNTAFCLLLLFFIVPLHATSQPKPFRTYTIDNGLISNSLETIFQDADGFMWFGSNEGLSIYDGYRFNNYTQHNHGLSDNSINSFFAKSKDETWVVHTTGIDVFVKRRFIRTIPLKGLNSIIRTSDGRVIAAGNNGLYEIREENSLIKRADFDRDFYHIYETNGHFIVDDANWAMSFLFDKFFRLQDSVKTGGFIEKDNYQKYWISGGTHGLFLIDTAAILYGRLRLLSPPKELKVFAKERVVYIFTDSDHSCWMSVYEKGISRVDIDGHIITFDESNGLNSNRSGFFFEDAEGNMWVSGLGITKFPTKEIKILSKSEGLSSDYISSIAINGPAVWMAQVNGISCLYNNRIYNFPYKNGEKCTWTSIMTTGDSLWTGNTVLSLYKICYKPQLHLKAINSWPCYAYRFQFYKDGSLIFSNHLGLYRIVGNDKLEEIHADSKFFRFTMDGNTLVAGGRDNEGISVWTLLSSNGTLKLSLVKEFSSAVANHIYSIIKGNNGEFWIGTANMGIFKLSRNNGSYVLTNYNDESGLVGYNIGRMLIVSNNTLLAATSRGLFASKLVDESLHFEDVNRKYGFYVEAFDIKEKPDGDLFLATSKGLIIIRNKFQQKSLPPRVYFTKVLHNNHLDSNTTPISTIQKFAHTENNLSFEFVATSFRNEDQVLYSYFLNKNDRQGQWSEPQKIHNLYFPDLSPGKYSLQVKALSADNLWSTHPAVYNFIIDTPFWKTWWFAILLFLAVLSAMAGVFWFKLHELKLVLNVRTKISRDLHDEVGSTLSGISLFSAVAKKQLDNQQDKQAKESLDRIILNCDEILGKMGDIVWAINPENDSLDKLITRLKTFGIVTSGSKNIQFHFESTSNLYAYNLDMQRRRNIYLICKEAINNAIKYSACKNLYFKVSNDRHMVQINIIDDGKGFDITNSVTGNGLINMKTRAREIEAQLNIRSCKNEGTSLELSVKFT